jgi:hypothetical protein
LIGHFDPTTARTVEAERNGTTLQNAVRNYFEIEKKYRADPVEAPMFTWVRLGLNPAVLAAEFAKRFAGDLPTRAYAEGQAKGFEEGFAAGKIEQFGSERPDFETLRPRMAVLMASGHAVDLKDAYEQAKWSDPALREVEVMKRYPTPTAANKIRGLSAIQGGRKGGRRLAELGPGPKAS